MLWDVGARRVRQTISAGAAAPAAAVAFSSDSATLAWGRLDGRIQLWDWRRTGRSAPFGMGRSRSSPSLSTRSGRTLASGGLDGEVRLWDVNRARSTGPPMTGHAGPVQALEFSADGGMVASAGVESGPPGCGTHARDVPLATSLSPNLADIRAIALSADASTLASGGSDGTVAFWDVRHRRRLSLTRPGGRRGVADLALSETGRQAAAILGDGTTRVWDAAGLRPPTKVLDEIGVRPRNVALSADGNVATAGFDPAVMLGDTAHRRAAAVLSRGYPGYSVRFSPDGRTLAAGLLNGRIRLWDVASQGPVGRPLGGESTEVVSLAFSRDGTHLASGDIAGEIALWDVARGRRLRGGLQGHRGEVIDLAFAADARTLASAGADRTVRLWDVPARRVLGRPLEGHHAPVQAVAVTPAGQVVSADRAGAVLLWDRLLLDDSARAWRERICRLAGRSLSRAEWDQTLPGRPYAPACER